MKFLLWLRPNYTQLQFIYNQILKEGSFIASINDYLMVFILICLIIKVLASLFSNLSFPSPQSQRMELSYNNLARKRN